jgi:hypothetical protein
MRKLKFSLSLSRHLRSGQSPSQAVLEFALALPVLLMLIFGIIDFALLFQAWLSVENIARQTIRYAVTGEYNPYYCQFAPAPDGTANCAGDSYLAEQDYARLRSIKAAAQQWEVAIFKNGTTVQSAKGYLNVTICSSRDADQNRVSDFDWTIPIMATTTYAKCVLHSDPTVAQEDAGGPGDNVFVFVDFNHPLITPFLSQIWPMVHLVSYRQGVVETFRTSHSIAQVGQGLQSTPTNTDTPTPSNTPTFTPSPTLTPSPTPTLTFTPTMTPSKTATPSLTPTPDCSLYNFTGGFVLTTYSGGTLPRVQIGIENAAPDDAYISSLTFVWASYDGAVPSQDLNRIRFNGVALSNTDDPGSPSTWSGIALLAAGSNPQFQFDYVDTDAQWPDRVPASSFGLSVGLSNGCTVTLNAIPFATLTPTITLTPSRTPSPTITLTPSRTPTRTPITPTRTPTITLTPSKTPIPTITRTPTKTFTPSPRPPTNTPTPFYTRTPVPPTPAPTNTRPPAPTRTPIPIPTNTRTPVPTRTPIGGGG